MVGKPGPRAVNQQPLDPTNVGVNVAISESDFGSNPNQLGQQLPHQFSNNSVKTLNIKLHILK